MKEVNVYKVEYKIGENQWTACIAAFDPNEAIEHIKKVLNKNIVVMTIGKETRLDAVVESVRDKVISDAYGVENEIKEKKVVNVVKKRSKKEEV